MIALALALSLWFLSDEGTGTITRIGIEGDIDSFTDLLCTIFNVAFCHKSLYKTSYFT